MHEAKIRVRYAETDQMGVVYHGHYAQYFEVSRAEMIREMGLTYKEIEKRGIIMPITNLQISYFRPARYDDLLTIRSEIQDIPEKRLVILSKVYNQEEVKLAEGQVTLAFVDAQTGKSVPAPDFFLELIRPSRD